jgi:hypothetical protein
VIDMDSMELAVAQLVKKLFTFHGTPRSISQQRPLVVVLCQMNPVHKIPTYFFKIHFNSVSQPRVCKLCPRDPRLKQILLVVVFGAVFL